MRPPDEIQDQAALLARWLEEHPGAPAPDGLDIDVLEAVYALRPDLAPAPGISIDDILAGVTTGPFAAGVPAEPAPAEVLQPPSLPAPSPAVDLAAVRGRARGWFWPTAGALAAAAMALIVVLPQLEHGVPDLSDQRAVPPSAVPPEASPIAEVAEVAEVAPAPPLAEPASAVRPTEVGAADLSQPHVTADVSVISATEKDTLGGIRAGAGHPATTAAATRTAPAPRPAGPAPTPAEPAGGWFEAGPSAAREVSKSASVDLDDFAGAEEQAPMADQGSTGELRAKQEAAPARAAATAGTASLARDEAKARFEEVEAVEEEGADMAAAPSARASAGRGRSQEDSERASRAGAARKRADDRALEALPAAPPADLPAPAIAEVPAQLDALRAAANPLDYRSDWYLSDPSIDPATRAQLAAAFGQVQAAIVAGDTTTAITALEPFLALSHSAVVQDVAFRLATLHLQAGRLEQASALVRRGLAAGAGPTVYRSRLLALQGALLEEAGRSEEAAESYRQAVRANASRP